ncbi:MAG: class I SAM-dependent methyltransferase [Planctomycetaceae bacterium]|nr:class I SAM-dependent methyltransferase [Planctomycetaceae bacterium]
MSTSATNASAGWKADPDLLRCVACDGALTPAGAGFACAGCGRSYPVRDGVLVVKEEPKADNRIAADFYNSPLWPKFRFWEWLFFVCNGGERRSRDVILRHLPRRANLSLLDVAIGDGVYLAWLPADWSVVGIDVSTVQLAACRRRNASRDLRLVLGEAEALPFRADRFDAVLSIGGFNHFNDPEGALREMVRVVRPGGTIVISDELPNLTDRMLFRKLGLPGVDRWIVARLMHLGDAFTDLVERHRDLDIAATGRAVLKDCRYEEIWHGGGYVMVGQAP